MAHLPLIALTLFATNLHAADFDLSSTLRAIEQRYNSTRTLQSDFEQSVYLPGGRRTTESGTLYLLKPGRMRWEYSTPTGKLFLSDAKQIYFVSPLSRRVEISPVKESADLRAPLAFLLGKLDFSRDFSRYETSPTPDGAPRIRAFPTSKNSPYEYVEFTPGPGGLLISVAVQGRDGSRMDYRFRNEQRNLALAPSLFTFAAPAGFEVVQLRAPQ